MSLVATAGLIIVARPDFPANDVKALIAAAKANPGKISFASPGFGATQHFTGELFRQTAGIDILHVPFRSSPEAISAVVGKQVDVLFDTIRPCSDRSSPASSRRSRSPARTVSRRCGRRATTRDAPDKDPHARENHGHRSFLDANQTRASVSLAASKSDGRMPKARACFINVIASRASASVMTSGGADANHLLRQRAQ